MAAVVGLSLAACARDDEGAAPATPAAAQAVAKARPQRPPPPRAQEPHNVVVAIALGEFATFNRMLRVSGEGAALARMEQATLLAPRDTAFAQLDEAQRVALANVAPSPAVTVAIRRLSFDRNWPAQELKTAIRASGAAPLQLRNRAGEAVTFSLEGEMIRATLADGSTATLGDAHIPSRNGATYVLDRWVGPLPTGGITMIAPPGPPAPNPSTGVR